MKIFYTIILIWNICLYGYGQNNKLYGRWLTSESDFMLIEKEFVHFSILLQSKPGWSRVRHDANHFIVISLKDTIRLQRKFYEYPDKYYTENYDFDIISQNNIELVLTTISSFSKNLFQNKDTLRFIRQEYAVDSSIYFEKLCFYSYQNFNNVLQIDNNGNVYMQKEIFDKNRNSVIRCYEGILKRSLYKKLVHLLQTCNLKTLDWGSSGYSDTYEKVLIINYNDGYQKKLKSGHPSPISQPLIDYLTSIEKKVKLKETNIRQEIKLY